MSDRVFTINYLSDMHLNLPIYVTSAGYDYPVYKTEFKNGYPHYQIFITLEGECTLEIYEKTFSIGKNQMMILPPFEPHRYYRKGNCNWVVDLIGFDGKNIDKLLKSINLESIVHTIYCQNEIHEKLKRVVPLLRGNNPLKGFYASQIAYSILCDIVRSTTKDASIPQSIQKALNYIENNYSTTITLEQLSKVCGLSKNYFCTAFKKALNSTPFEYIVNFRINKSKYLLKTTEMSVGEISTICGFESANYFRNQFKKKTGVSPIRFRCNSFH